MESSRNKSAVDITMVEIITGGQNGVKSQPFFGCFVRFIYYNGGAKWSQVATIIWWAVLLARL